MTTDGVIFDLDGTLWDSCQSVAESWQLTARRYDPGRVISPERVLSGMGMTPWQLAEHLFPDMGEGAMELCRRCLDEECAYIAVHGAKVYPDAERVLSALSRRCPLYLVSNCVAGYIECFFELTGFGRYFTDYLNHDMTGLDKAGNIRLMIDRHDIKRPVYVGDTAQDGRNAREAGCGFIFALYGFGSAEGDGPSISSLGELEGALEQL